jgi:hypothetical protein
MAVASIFGAPRKPPRRGATAALSIVTVLALAAGIPAWAVFALWAHQQELRRDWDIKGPPCPPARDSWQSIVLKREPHTFKYGGADFAHPFGGADCSSVPDGGFITRKAYYVCQFTGPIMIAVATGGRTVPYEPGPGRRATVSLRRGRLACVLGGWSTG